MTIPERSAPVEGQALRRLLNHPITLWPRIKVVCVFVAKTKRVLLDDEHVHPLGHQLINQQNDFSRAAPEPAQFGDHQEVFCL